jgi:hypothetical protein
MPDRLFMLNLFDASRAVTRPPLLRIVLGLYDDQSSLRAYLISVWVP